MTCTAVDASTAECALLLLHALLLSVHALLLLLLYAPLLLRPLLLRCVCAGLAVWISV